MNNRELEGQHELVRPDLIAQQAALVAEAHPDDRLDLLRQAARALAFMTVVEQTQQLQRIQAELLAAGQGVAGEDLYEVITTHMTRGLAAATEVTGRHSRWWQTARIPEMLRAGRRRLAHW